MVKGYFADDATRAERVQKLFDTIAPRYDLINNLQSFGLHHHWKRRFVALANPNVEDHALDLCCGTGDVSFALADSGTQVTGLDFSQVMLDYAKVRDELTRVTFCRNTTVIQFVLSSVTFGITTRVCWRFTQQYQAAPLTDIGFLTGNVLYRGKDDWLSSRTFGHDL